MSRMIANTTRQLGVAVGLAALLCTGCKIGGAGLFSLFGSGSSNDSVASTTSASADGSGVVPEPAITPEFQDVPIVSNPEPTTIALFATGFLGMGWMRRRSRRLTARSR